VEQENLPVVFLPVLFWSVAVVAVVVIRTVRMMKSMRGDLNLRTRISSSEHGCHGSKFVMTGLKGERNRTDR
jgi:hypothetical protein